MPGFDGTGPFGNLGNCRRTNALGRGCGRRFGRRLDPVYTQQTTDTETITLTKTEQLKILEAELKKIKDQKKGIEKKLNELRSKTRD